MLNEKISAEKKFIGITWDLNLILDFPSYTSALDMSNSIPTPTLFGQTCNLNLDLGLCKSFLRELLLLKKSTNTPPTTTHFLYKKI